jgi:4-hydroxythreonine-4-phosphate dehydrogenase
MGDPAGIAPEVIARSLADPEIGRAGGILIVGSWALMRAAFERYAPGVGLLPLDSVADWDGLHPGILDVPVPDEAGIAPGKPSRASARVAGEAVRVAAGMAIDGAVDAVVTAPLTKWAFAEMGLPHHGHTEYFAWRSGSTRFAMMFVFGQQRVILATTHLPLAKVSESLSKRRIIDCVALLDETLGAHFGTARPRLGVAGLNPHAGEGGLLGVEEQEIVLPAVVECREAGIQVSGPHPADTLFWRMAAGEFDGVVALYHDQALIPVKLLGPEHAVNVTVGLPFVRTSASHGTAFDIAGRGIASEASMVEAIHLAGKMVIGSQTPQ